MSSKGEQNAGKQSAGATQADNRSESSRPMSGADAANVKQERKLIVGLDRYSPVALVKHRQWKKGKPEHAWEYQGVVYMMCDESEAQDFKNDPEKYAPKLLGCDPVVLWTSDKAVVGSTQFGAIFDESLYLFSSAANRDRFKQEPTLFSRPQHALKLDDVNGQFWR